jgi:hypothetical protein
MKPSTLMVYNTRKDGFVYDVFIDFKDVPERFRHYFTNKEKVSYKEEYMKVNSITLSDIAEIVEKEDGMDKALEVLDNIISYVHSDAVGVIIEISTNKTNTINQEAYLKACEWYIDNNLSLSESGKNYLMYMIKLRFNMPKYEKDAYAYGNMNWLGNIMSYSGSLLEKKDAIKNIYIKYGEGKDMILNNLPNKSRVYEADVLPAFMFSVKLLKQVCCLTEKDKLNVYFDQGLAWKSILSISTMDQSIGKVGFINKHDTIPDHMNVCFNLKDRTNILKKRKFEFSCDTYRIEEANSRGGQSLSDIEGKPYFAELTDYLTYTGDIKDNTVKEDLYSINITGGKTNYAFDVHMETFMGCTNLKTFTYSKNLIIGNIFNGAFSNTSLEYIKLKNGLTTIDCRAFIDTNLTRLSIPKSVQILDRILDKDTHVSDINIKSNSNSISGVCDCRIYYTNRPKTCQRNTILNVSFDKIVGNRNNVRSQPMFKWRFFNEIKIHRIEESTDDPDYKGYYVAPGNDFCVISYSKIWTVILDRGVVKKLFSAYKNEEARKNITEFFLYTFDNSNIHEILLSVNSYVKNSKQFDQFFDYLNDELGKLFRCKCIIN